MIETGDHVEPEMMTDSLCLSPSVLFCFFLSHSLSSVENVSVGVGALWHIAFLDASCSYEEDVIAAQVADRCSLKQLFANGVVFINTTNRLITLHLVTPPLTFSYFLK